MDVEAKPTFASGNIEIEVAIAEVQAPRWVEGVVDRAQRPANRLRADPKAADIAIGRQSEAVAEVSACLAPARMIDKLLQRSAA